MRVTLKHNMYVKPMAFRQVESKEKKKWSAVAA